MTASRRKPKHYIREHRQAAGLSLRGIAERLTDDTGEPLVSYASLSRMECGRTPYSQQVLEALAEELHTTPADLLARHPLQPRQDQQLSQIVAALDQAKIELDKARKMIDVLRKGHGRKGAGT